MRRATACAMGLGAALAAGPAGAQTEAVLERHLRHEFATCTLGDLRVEHRGALDGLRGTVVVATYLLEACAGGNNSSSRFGVFALRGGRIRHWHPRLASPLSVERVRVARGRMLVEGLRWGPGDAQCCPSVPVTAAFVPRGNSLVPAP